MAGLSKGLTLQDIARRHAYDDSSDSTSKEKIQRVYNDLKQELKKGIKVEKEHTSDVKRAARIAMDHLVEDPKYYSKLSKIGLEENLNKDLVKEFMKHVMNELELDSLPPIKLSDDSQEAIDMRSWGGYQPSDKSIYIVTAKRHPADVFRTLAHELVHYKQDTEGRLKPGSGMTGSDDENEANSRAAVIMRNFAQASPNLFEHLNNEGKFGNYLFGDKDSGVKIGWYDSEKEQDTPAEKALFDLLKKYADSIFPEYSQINIDDLVPSLEQLKREYPDILNADLKDDAYIYRGTTLSGKELDTLGANADTVYFEQGYIIKDQTYSSKRQLSSWSTDYYPAATFAITSSDEKGGYPVVMRAKASDANLYFNPEFLSKLSTQPEKEVLNTTNPIPVDIMVINLGED